MSPSNSNTLPAGVTQALRQDVQSMHAYAIQDSAGFIKLDAMENPFSLPPALQQALGERLGRVALNRYPAQRVADLKDALARYLNLPKGLEVMLGNGSDELISLLAMACDTPGATIVAPVPGFVMYAMSAQLQGLNFVGVPLTDRFELDTSAMLKTIEQHRPAITYIAYPNNPTANLFNDESIDQIIVAVGQQGGLIVIDEAYQPFASRSRFHDLTQHPHVLVMRTLSKFGLAGVRLGYLVGARALIHEIDKVRPPYNVSVLNAEAAIFALEHHGEYARQAEVIRAERQSLIEKLQALHSVQVYPSEANMILIRVPDAKAIFEGMKRRGVLIKNVSSLHPLLQNCLRLTIGTPEENRLMLQAFSESLTELNPT